MLPGATDGTVTVADATPDVLVVAVAVTAEPPEPRVKETDRPLIGAPPTVVVKVAVRVVAWPAVPDVAPVYARVLPTSETEKLALADDAP